MSDSAGVPWEGRHFEPNPAADDDGSAPEPLMAAIRRFRAGEGGEAEVVGVEDEPPHAEDFGQVSTIWPCGPML